jgi:hypothetical protein
MKVSPESRYGVYLTPPPKKPERDFRGNSDVMFAVQWRDAERKESTHHDHRSCRGESEAPMIAVMALALLDDTKD